MLGAVSDVDADLEEVDAQRTLHEALREEASRKLQRLRYLPCTGNVVPDTLPCSCRG